ncbi:MAG: glucose-1-phosphate cytidylyltransferase [Acidobacteria bacterium]|nr:glucose-1-phosphate cytidylyltransferase [Acidobacteriota bacterium]
MKAVILAGGYGTRISEETDLKPKPLIEIGGKPILWHIMKIYSSYGVTEFIICLGYKGYLIKEFFANYYLHTSDVTFDIAKNQTEFLNSSAEPWRVTLIDTGQQSMTGGRLKRVATYIKDEESFCFTYGDGVGNIDIKQLIEFHHSKGVLATMTAVAPSGRFGATEINTQDLITSFQEKPHNGGWINGGFFVCSPAVLDYISGDDCVWEREPLENLAKDLQIAAYKHYGFWQPMDTLREKNLLESLWQQGKAPWKTWD